MYIKHIFYLFYIYLKNLKNVFNVLLLWYPYCPKSTKQPCFGQRKEREKRLKHEGERMTQSIKKVEKKVNNTNLHVLISGDMTPQPTF